MELAKILLMLFVVFVLAKVAAFLVRKVGIPGLVGEILVGIILVVSIGDTSLAQVLGLYDVSGGVRISGETFETLSVFADLGVMFLLFSVGLETRVKDLTSVGKAAFLVALLGVIFPFVLGFIYVYCIYAPDNMKYAMFLGAAMVATSVGITARVIKDRKLIDAKESRIIIGAAVIDDILGMIVLAIVSGMASGEGSIDIGNVVLITIEAFAFVIAVLLFAGLAVPRIHDKMAARAEAKFRANKDYIPTKLNMLAVSIAVCLAFSWLAEYIGLAAIIGAFLAGMIFAEFEFEWNLLEKVEAISTFLVSFFFVFVGIQVDLDSISVELLLAFAIVLVLAIIGKYVGCGLGAKLGDKSLDFGSMNIIGVGMIPRGEVGIIVASIGLRTFQAVGDSGFNDLYTIVVLMSVLTTIIAPPLLTMAFKKKFNPDYKVQPADQM